MKRRAVAVAAWIAVALTVLGWHPALRPGAPLSDLARQIAEDGARGRSWVGALGFYDAGVPFAFWALNLSLLYLAAWTLHRLCPRPTESPRGDAWPLLVAALVGQVAATPCAARWGDATAFYFGACGVAALAIVPLWRSRGPVSEAGARRGRFAAASLAGLLLVLLASPLDAALVSLTGAGMLPEAWFPLSVEFGSAGRWPVAAALSLVVAAACGAMGMARAGWLGLAPACVLVLGPSNPAKGLAAAAVVAALGRAGAGWPWRAGFLAASVAFFVILSFAMQ